jgi:ABC-type multidrug transport system ATPase subunit
MFKTDWTFKVQSGMNLMIGINAIGKTTTTNILTYGIVGNHQGVHEDLDPGYFMQRLKNLRSH